MSPLEIAASVLGLISVWLTVKRNILCWPIGAVMVAMYTYIFWDAKLYADAGLQVFFFVLQLYGWWYWARGGEKQERPIRRLTQRQFATNLAGGGVAVAVIGTLLKNYTDQALPYGDTTVTVFSVIAQILMARKFVECWPLWVGVDLVAIGVYAMKELYPTSVLYGVFTVMAVLGWREWQRVKS